MSLGSAKLSAPIYDNTSGNVIVGDLAGALHSVTASTGAIHGTAAGIGDAIADAPLVDGSDGIVFVFVNMSGSYSETAYNAVYEFSTGFTVFGTPGVTAISSGPSAAGYSCTLAPSTMCTIVNGPAEGSIYVIGNTGSGTASLYRVGITGGGISSSTAVVTGLNSTEHPFPSPVTEFCTNAGTDTCPASTTATTTGTDFIFFSVNRGAKTGCINTAGNGCVLAYNVNSTTTTPTEQGNGENIATPGTNGCWATSGIAVDNAVTTGGNSQLYFIGLGTNDAGGATTGAAGQTSSTCTTGAATTIGATQTSQVSP